MSHAEYAPKQLPVLTRLVMTLRQIPAVQTALARLKSLFRSGTNPEPIAIDAFAAGSAVVDATETVDPSPVTTPPATPLPFQATSETIVVDALPADGPVVADDTHEPDDVVPAEMQPIVPLPSEAAPGSAIVDALLTDESVVVADTVEMAGAPEIATPTTLLSSEDALEPVTIDAVADLPLVADDLVESDHVVPAAAPPVAPIAEEATCEPIAAAFVADAPAAAIDTIKNDDVTPAVAQPTEKSEREALVRRRWRETGIRMWNPAVHGAGQSSLCIQGRVELLPPTSGETMPRYDRLEFKLIDGDIVCEGFLLEPPERPRQRALA